MEVYIYALIDPRDNQVRYVGKSKEPEQRLKKHISPPVDSPVRQWVMELRTFNLKPEMSILETVSFWDSGKSESKWIKKYPNLLNRQIPVGYGSRSHIGQHEIYHFRKSCNVTQSELRKEMDLSLQSVRAVESGIIDVTEEFKQKMMGAVKVIRDRKTRAAKATA